MEPQEQELLAALEDAYNRGITLEQMEGNISDDAMAIAQDFFSKKKDGTAGSQIATPGVLASESLGRPMGSPSTQLESESQAVANGIFSAIEGAKERGVTLDQMKDNVTPEVYTLAQEYYKSVDGTGSKFLPAMQDHNLIIDENPSELGRLWNRAAAGGMLADAITQGEITGDFNWEAIAYYNYIIQRDAPKDSDYLSDQTGSTVDDFVLDVIRTIPESMISMGLAWKSGGEGAAVGAGVGAGVGSIVPVAGTAIGAKTGATIGFFAGTSLALEYGHSFVDVFREQGIDVTDVDELKAAVQDPELLSAAREKGLKRGIPIAIFDAISGGVAGKVGSKAIQSVGKTATNRALKVGAAETLVQAALGGTGELAGQVISGEEIRPRDIALEAFAELGPAAPVMAYRLTGRIGKTPGELEYMDWAEQQDQGKLVQANEISFTLNNGEISSLDNEIAKLKESQKEDPTTKKAVEAKLRRLKDEKYRLLKEYSEKVMGLDAEAQAQANELTSELMTAAEVLKKGDINAEEKAAIEEEMENNARELDNIINKREPSDTKTGTEEVPSGEQVGQELGDVPESQISRAQAQISGILQERAQNLERSSRHSSPEQAAKRFLTAKKGKFFNLFDRNDAAALQQMLEKGEWGDGQRITPTQRRTLNKLILASEAFAKLEPDSKAFNIGFGKQGYYKAGQQAGFTKRDLKGSAGIFSGAKRSAAPGQTSRVGNSIAVEIPLKRESLSGRGTADRFTPQGTAYHEIYHSIFSKYFNDNPIDFNQFRKLVIRRLSGSSVKELNNFTQRYMEREDAESAGAYKSEEFMVELGGLLADERMVFEPSFLEEVKAFLNAIVSKLTGKKVQIFEDAALAKDIAEYMKGMAKAVRAGTDISQVPMSERLQTERFQRKRPETREKKEVDEYGYEKSTGEVEQVPSENAAGIPDPENYEKTYDPLEKMVGFIKPKFDNLVKKLEKILGVKRLRSIRKDVLQALEVSESINVQHINRFFLALRQVNRITNKMKPEQRERFANLANDYLFGENAETRDNAIKEILNENPELAKQLSRLSAIRASMQESIQNSSVFSNLSTELQNVIKDNTAMYGTRTYRAFTDPNFKFDPQLRRAAEKAMVEGTIMDMAFDIDENMTEQIANDMMDMGLNPEEFDDVVMYVEATQKTKIRKQVSDSLRGLEEAAERQREGYGEGLSGSRDLGKLRIPTKKLKGRLDLPIELMEYLGIEKDPYVKFSQTIATLTNMVQQFTLTDRVNEIAQRSNLGDLILTGTTIRNLEKNTLSFSQLVELGRTMGVIQKGESLVDFYKRLGYNELLDEQGNRKGDTPAEKEAIHSAVYDFYKKNYTRIEEKKSPMNGKAVKNDFVGMLKQTPLYQSDNKALQAYYQLLLQMRRVRVLYNLPTWRKNIMGGWYFLAANFVLPYNKHRGGFTVMKDLKNRFKKMKEGVVDPELELVLNRMGELGLLGSSPNMGMFSDINQSFIDQIEGVSPDVAWNWLPQAVKNAQRKGKTRAARVAYQYGFIDDYTKMIAYLTKRENFAKRLESNPEGKSYKELNSEQQQQVDEMTAERIKQNMPTMSRIHPSLRNLFKLPVGDFLSFRVEAFRSYFSIYKNAVEDLSMAMTNENLTQSQREAYMVDGVGTLSMGMVLAGLSTMGYQAIANMLLDDDEETELGEQARGTNYILPPWMQGSNIVAVGMNDSGKIRFANMSSEDPYDELQGLIFGRDGISRNDQLLSILSDFKDPNLAARLLFNLVDGKDSYGRPILDNEDVGWINRYIIGPNLTDWSDAYGSYVFKETFIPPNINYIAREYRKRMKQAEENPDIELQPLETALELSTAFLFRDYPVDISKQFYYNMNDQNFRKPYLEMNETERVKRKARLDEVVKAYNFASNYSAKFKNYDIVNSVESTIKRTFKDSPEEVMYVLYGVELPE